MLRLSDKEIFNKFRLINLDNKLHKDYNKYYKSLLNRLKALGLENCVMVDRELIKYKAEYTLYNIYLVPVISGTYSDIQRLLDDAPKEIIDRFWKPYNHIRMSLYLNRNGDAVAIKGHYKGGDK